VNAKVVCNICSWYNYKKMTKLSSLTQLMVWIVTVSSFCTLFY